MSQSNDSGLNLDHLEARTQNMDLVIARLEQIVGGCDNASERAEEALICARAALANQPAPTVQAKGVDERRIRDLLRLHRTKNVFDQDDWPIRFARAVRAADAHQPAQEQAEPIALDDLDFTPDAQHQVADMANVGYELMQTIKAMRPDYCWNETPAEIVSDLINELADAAQQEPVAAPQKAAALGALDADEMTRLRRLMAALGHSDAFELTDDYVRGILCTLLGQAAGKLERATIAAISSAPGTPEAPQTAAARDVLAERQRQVEQEGWTLAHDDQYRHSELAHGAAAYALVNDKRARPACWPWAVEWWKPLDDRRNLVRAGALVLAEIERLDRAAQLDGGQEGSESNG